MILEDHGEAEQQERARSTPKVPTATNAKVKAHRAEHARTKMDEEPVDITAEAVRIQAKSAEKSFRRQSESRKRKSKRKRR